ncbi:hypothetical protein OROHE_025320 [Orobanche hederae]
MLVIIVVVLILVCILLLLFTFLLVVVVYLLLVLLFHVLLSGMPIKKIYPENEQERGPDGNNNLLKWWAKRSTIFPVVATIAKEILAVPASTVSVEQAFSTGGYNLDERRSRLTPQNLEAQSLMNDWVKAELRQQEQNYDE